MRRRRGFQLTCAAVATTPFTGLDLVWFLSLPDIFLLVAASAVLVSALERGAIDIQRTALLGLFGLCILFGVEVAAIPNAVQPLAGAIWARTRLGNLLLLASVLLTVDSRRDIYVLLRLLCVSLLIVAVLTVLHSVGLVEFGDSVIEPRWIFGYQIPFRRTLGVPMDYGNFGMYMSLGTAYLLYETDQFDNWWALGALPVFLLAVFISQSRSSWLAVGSVVGLILAYKALNIIWGRIRPAFGYSLLAVAVIAVPFAMVGVARWLIAIDPLTLYSRLHAYRTAFSVYLQSPLIGIGRASYFHAYGTEVIHNGVLSILVSFGPLAFVLFLAVYTLAFRTGLQTACRSRTPFLWVTLLAAYAGVSVELMLFDGSYTKILWLTVGLLLSGATVYHSEADRGTVTVRP
ncbi:O-antigen ligase family protein [Haloarcula marina]|uniref:O-antigen ligase family protein n=1 Tax=Haloarcula marina TaxID=2961574 RepID=UPI0020B6C3CE|nr:O-antigen ligase family protein [Halomicroarcula marina]